MTAGVAEFGNLLVFLLRCAGSDGWMDAPYTIGTVAPSDQVLLPATTTAFIWILLDERGIIRALRYASLTAEFMRAVRYILEK